MKMMVEFKFEFECGDTTCSNPDTGKMCKFVYTRKFGQVWYCHLFPDDDLESTQPHGEGRLVRHPLCMATVFGGGSKQEEREETITTYQGRR